MYPEKECEHLLHKLYRVVEDTLEYSEGRTGAAF
jgi:hypothetical protein